MWEPTQLRDGEGRRHGFLGERQYPCLWSHRGNGDGMSAQGDRTQHGKPQRWMRDPTGCPRGTGRAVWGVGEVHSTVEAGQRRWREGASVQGQRSKWREPGDWREPNTFHVGSETTGNVACQSEEGAQLSLLCAV